MIGVREMACPFWEGKTFVNYCHAHSDGLMIPSIAEERDYCRGDGFWQCPIYRKFVEKELAVRKQAVERARSYGYKTY